MFNCNWKFTWMYSEFCLTRNKMVINLIFKWWLILCQLHWTLERPDSWLNIISKYAWKGISKRDSHLTQRPSKQMALPNMCGYHPIYGEPEKSWIWGCLAWLLQMMLLILRPVDSDQNICTISSWDLRSLNYTSVTFLGLWLAEGREGFLSLHNHESQYLIINLYI